MPSRWVAALAAISGCCCGGRCDAKIVGITSDLEEDFTPELLQTWRAVADAVHRGSSNHSRPLRFSMDVQTTWSRFSWYAGLDGAVGCATPPHPTPPHLAARRSVAVAVTLACWSDATRAAPRPPPP